MSEGDDEDLEDEYECEVTETKIKERYQPVQEQYLTSFSSEQNLSLKHHNSNEQGSSNIRNSTIVTDGSSVYIDQVVYEFKDEYAVYDEELLLLRVK